MNNIKHRNERAMHLSHMRVTANHSKIEKEHRQADTDRLLFHQIKSKRMGSTTDEIKTQTTQASWTLEPFNRLVT